MASIVHCVGTGTIGSPLISLLARHKKDFGIDEVTFHKNTPLKTDMAGIKQLMSEGAILSTDKSKFKEFEDLGVKPKYAREEAIERATVVIDATPKGFGTENKVKYYDKFKNTVKGFIAQGSESGFGKPFAYEINNEALTKNDQFIQVVSCNTHNICALVKTFYDNAISEGRFVCIRRTSDISQNDDFSPGIKVDKHKDGIFGTHHSLDATRVLETLGGEVPLLKSSSCVVPTQYMHAVHFALLVGGIFDVNSVIEAFKKNKMVALTNKTTSNTTFSFGRDFGHFGRILNQTVVSVPTLHVSHVFYDGLYEVTGFCFTPQDGNSLMSSVASTLWFLNNKNWSTVKEKIKCLDPYLFKEI